MCSLFFSIHYLEVFLVEEEGSFVPYHLKKIVYITSSNTFYTSILFYILIHPAVKSIHLKFVGLNLPTVEDDVFSTAWFYKFTPMNSKKKDCALIVSEFI